MHELKAVLAAAADLHARGALPVLATVVDVKGSVYRRPGATCSLLRAFRPWARSAEVSGEGRGRASQRASPRRATPVADLRLPIGEDVVWGLGLGATGESRFSSSH